MTTPEQSPRLIDLRAQLLDRQIVDCDDNPVGIVEEVELNDENPPRVVAILTGRALLNRLSGSIPRVDLLDRLDIADVDDIDTVVTLTKRRDEVPLAWTEDWIRDHIIGKIPGSYK